MVLEAIKENEAIKSGVNLFIKTAIYGAVIIGTVLILEKVFGFGFEISAHLGL